MKIQLQIKDESVIIGELLNKGEKAMEKIVDIFGHFTNFDEMYEPENSWYGPVLVGKDHHFEGVVRDYNEKDYYYVFGTMSKEKLDVYKCAKEDHQVPHRYEATRVEGKYFGTYYGTNGFVEIPVGECNLSLMPAEQTREESSMEVEHIKKRIEMIKKELGENSVSLLNYLEQAAKAQTTTGKVEK